MIKFFRHIRKSLLEQNKMGRYFKYAIGEITLVMIGILLALQVNNWNEQQKKKTLKNEYVTSLINDFTKDTTQLNARLLRNNVRLDRIGTISDSIILSHKNNYKNIIELFSNAFSGVRITNVYNTNSFNLLISSGNIDLLDKNIRTELMELNRLQGFEQAVQDGNSEYLFKYLENIGLKYPHSFGRFSSGAIYKSLWDNTNTKDLPKDMISFLSQETYTINRYIELTNDVLKQTELVLKLLYQLND
ncbi:DUF6090 family protein [Ichthyenterobacterium sp. W332]|uniref:DUF6090 family protein n=1 Tax=Microcosmobacter mediterraneus TaxID=3075607 RepID=A0ABU2YMM7_9FLAO|nr:DUF6090 family protein [Ichthyenterobacterium sp. W332]MDT0559136.1 DUF6090 family protein [Ichthyenterobacterium sp. W332]